QTSDNNNFQDNNYFDDNISSQNIVSSKGPSKQLLKWYDDTADEDILDFMFSKSGGKLSKCKKDSIVKRTFGIKKPTVGSCAEKYHNLVFTMELTSTPHVNCVFAYIYGTWFTCSPVSVAMADPTDIPIDILMSAVAKAGASLFPSSTIVVGASF
nr:hypothetical protein [Tanacetum cinerariifolium]